MAAASATPCPWCGSLRGVVHVHGHGQCVTCNTNIEPCCAGDSGQDAATQDQTNERASVAPHLFEKVFGSLGGSGVTVTTSALLFALSNRLGCDLDEARLVLEAAERIGIVRTQSAGLHSLQDVVPQPVDPSGPAP